jgi:predicted MPP superfamily phosphohydrolase
MQWVWFTSFLVVLGLLSTGAVHLISHAFPPPAKESNRWRTTRRLAAVLLPMASVLGRILDGANYTLPARILMTVGDLWIAILFWFYCLMIPVGLWNLLVRLLCTHHSVGAKRHIPIAAFTRFACLLIFLLLLWGTLEASSISVREVKITTARLLPPARPLQIVQLSDIHLSLSANRRLIEKAVTIVNHLKPDVIVLTGDTVGTPQIQRLELLQSLGRLEAPMGTFAIPGNHEYYSGIKQSIAALQTAGFTILRDQAAQIGGGPRALLLVGFDDPARQHFDGPRLAQERTLLPPGEPRPFTVVLRHRPDVPAPLLGRFDLQLSGHTHGGQLQPFEYFIRLLFPFTHGLHNVGKGSVLYVSRGLGTWGPSVRFLARPEITLFTISPAQPQARTPPGPELPQGRAYRSGSAGARPFP